MTPNRIIEAIVLSGGLLLVGCGARSALAEAGASAAGGGAGSTGSGQGTATTSSSSSSGQGGGGGGGVCAPVGTAIPVTLNAVTPTQGTLSDSCFDTRVYSFCGKKGDTIYVQTYAQPPGNGFDPAYLDTVVGVSLSTGAWGAENDDPVTGDTRDAQLFTVLPSDGDYFLSVSGAGGLVDEDHLTACEYPGWMEPTNHDYAVAAFKIPVSPIAAPDYTFDVEPDDSLAAARPLEYAKDAATQKYRVSRIAGQFDSVTDIDVYSFTIPTDAASVDPMKERQVGYFYLPYDDSHGDGSTAEIGSTWIVDAMDPAHRVASLELVKDPAVVRLGHELAPPLVFGHPYYLFVSRPPGAVAGTNDFYFVSHYGGASAPIEKADTTALKNDTPAHAEPLAGAKAPNALARYDVDGDISPANDVDFYTLAMPAGASYVNVECGGERLGSGLRGFTIALFASDGTTLLDGPSGELPERDAQVAVILPGGNAAVLLRIEATSQDPGVTSTFYRCHAYLQ